MKVIQFVAKISYNDISKLFCVADATYDNVFKAALKEFQIPSNEASEKKLCDVDGSLYNKETFEEIIQQSISEGRIPHIKVIPGNEQLLNNSATSSSNQSEDKEDDAEQQNDPVKDFRSKVNNLFLHLDKIEDKLHVAEVKLKKYETDIDSGIEVEPNHHSTDLEGRNDLQEALKEREVKLGLRETAILESESRLKQKEDELNQRDIELNQRDIELNKLHRRLIRRDNKLKIREEDLKCREIEVSMQHYALNKVEKLLDVFSTGLQNKKEQLDEQEALLNKKDAMLEEEKGKLKCYRRIVRSKARRCKTEIEGNSEEKEEDTKMNEKAATLNRSRVMTNSFLMELEEKLSKKKSRVSSSPGIVNGQQDTLSGSSAALLNGNVMSNNHAKASTSHELQEKFDHEDLV